MTVEYRQISGDDTELRAAEGDGMSFSGYAAKFNSRSEDLGFREVIEPGAFARSLKSRNEIKAFVNHDTNLVIGSTRAGTLRLSEDAKGLPAEIDLPDTTYGRDLSVSVKRGDSSGMSFGFSVVKDEWSADYSQRRLIEVRLHEVSVVTGFPAYKSTTATVRSLARLAHRTQQDVEALADAVMALEAGSELSDEQYGVIVEAADRSRAKAAAEEPPAPEADLVSLLTQKLSLLEKSL